MFISPMLLETSPRPFSHEDYVFEPKIDGHRLILSRIGGQTRLYTRHNNDCTRQYPELIDITPDDVILDGEVAATDTDGAIDFESVMERFSLKKADKIRRAAADRPVNFIVFDILQYKGVDLRALPLYKRKEILDELDLGNPHIAKIPSIDEDGESLYKQIVNNRMEGVVAKRSNSIYVSSRSDTWLKIINWTFVDVYITGYRKGDFGWLASVAEPGGKLRPAGVIELGVTPKQRMAFYSVKDRLKTGEDKNFVYLGPHLRATVKIRNWTKSGHLRTPAFVEFIV